MPRSFRIAESGELLCILARHPDPCGFRQHSHHLSLGVKVCVSVQPGVGHEQWPWYWDQTQAVLWARRQGPQGLSSRPAWR